MRSQSFIVSVLIAGVMLFFGCTKPDSQPSSTVASDPTEKLPAKYKVYEEVKKTDFSEAARSPEFQQAIKDASVLLVAPPKPLISLGERVEVPGGVSFDVPSRNIEGILREAHQKFFEKGFYLFRYEQNFGIRDRLDLVGLLPTTDKYAVIAAMETNGDNYNIGTSGVIAWMKDMEKDRAYVLTGIGFDYMEGHLILPVKDAKNLAERMYEFCPDIVEQGVGDKDKLVAELEKGKLYFWWD